MCRRKSTYCGLNEGRPTGLPDGSLVGPPTADTGEVLGVREGPAVVTGFSGDVLGRLGCKEGNFVGEFVCSNGAFEGDDGLLVVVSLGGLVGE